MLKAAFDSSLKCAFALADDERILFSGTLDSASRDNDRKLPPWLRDVIAQHGVKLEDIRQWTVGTGPGSFAGLRSGIAFVMGICMATGASLRGVPSVVGIASQSTGASDSRIGVLMDARCGEVILMTIRNGRLETEGRVLRPEELLQDEFRCDRWITAQASFLPELPPDVQSSLQSVDGVDVLALLNDASSPWQSTMAEMIRSCEPLYVRPPVFVQPVTPRQDLA